MFSLKKQDTFNLETMSRLEAHYEETCDVFLGKKDRIVGVFLQGSQNYGLAVPTSDVDSKAVLVPCFEDIAFNHKPISTTHIRANEEHIDLKDIRLMFDTFRKQNLNFLEILFTQYSVINPVYEEDWLELIKHREEIARYNPHKAVKSMKGIAMEKYHAMEHRYESKLAVLDKYGYDPKQLHHLLRVEDYLRRYIAGERYEDCLRPSDREFLRAAKLGAFDLDTARPMAFQSLDRIITMADAFCDKVEDRGDFDVDEILKDTQRKIMKKAIKKELE